MTADECAVYLRYVDAGGAPDLDRLYHARMRRGLPASHMGGMRTLRFHRLYVDEWVRQDRVAGAASGPIDVDARVRALRETLRRRTG